MTRVAITGVGCISAMGNNYATFANNLLQGVCGIGPLTQVDTGDLRVKVAAEVKGYDGQAHFTGQQLSQMDRFAQFAVVSAREAAGDAGLVFQDELAARTAVVHGSGIGGNIAYEASAKLLYGENAKRLHPMTVPRLMPSAGASHISMDLGITGPTLATTSACASAGHAIATGVMMLRSGLVDVALVGGAEACFTKGTMKGWEALRVLALDTCRPFSQKRGGVVLGEGAGTLVLETWDHAQKRGAHIYAELSGIGMNADAGNLIQPNEERIVQVIQMAMADAGIAPEHVDYINAHGTGTAQNDATECRAIHGVFGARGEHLPVSSSKSMFGHVLGAGSALEAVATVVAMQHQTALPTVGYLGPDPKCKINCVPNVARPTEINHALSHSFAFGGLNTVLVFGNKDGLGL